MTRDTVQDPPSRQRVLVTGASSGIGRATVEFLHDKEAAVFAGARKPADLEALGEIPGVVPVRLDVTKDADVAATVETIGREQGRLDALVNNAGVALPGPLMELAVPDLLKQFEVNTFGVHRVTRACFPLLLASRGRVVNVSSFGGRFVYPFFGGYSMTKFALEAYSDALRRELAPHGVDVVVLEPGRVQTPIWDKGDAHLEQFDDSLFGDRVDAWAERTTKASKESDLTPGDIAREIHSALHAKKPPIRKLITPSPVKYFLFRKLPTRWVDWILGRV